MLDEKDIKLIEKMISKSIASVLDTNVNNETNVLLDEEWIPNESNLSNESILPDQNILSDKNISHIAAYEKRLNHRDGEKRKAKVIFALSGGKASKGSQTTRITLPITWVREMGITPDAREVEITFTENKIIIEKSK